MFHSSWDLEVHAREMQQCRLREADRARQADAAQHGGALMRVPASRFSMSRLVAQARTWLTPRRSPMVDPVAAAEASAQVPGVVQPIPVDDPWIEPAPRSSRLADPYAGMVVLARASIAQTAEEPCAVGDC